MRARKRNAALALVVVALAITWTVAGCAVVLPGGRPDGMPARHVFPVRATTAVELPVSYPEAGIAMSTRRMPVERAQFDASGSILFVEYLSGNRGCHRLVRVGARMEDGRLDVLIVEGRPAALPVSCTAEAVTMLTAISLSEPVDPLHPPPVHDGVSPGPVAIEPSQ
ncbi:MAG: hypothetical protein M3395_09415 [Chloroflexota bacterium]|nr:hypothetical protein [Chloroflexota bacterium]